MLLPPRCNVLIHVPFDFRSPDIPMMVVMFFLSIEMSPSITEFFTTQIDAPVSSKHRTGLSLLSNICT